MNRATWNGVVIAEATPEQCEIVEGNVYFPPEAVKRELLQESDTHTICPWKGTASYYSVVVDGEVNKDAGWYYPQPKDAAKQITNYVAFWHGVEISKN